MGTTFSSQIRTVADIIQVVTNCSKPEADDVEREICSKPENVAKLAAACGFSKLTVGYGGVLMVGGLYSAGTTLGAGVILTTAGLIGAKRYCNALVEKGLSGINAGQ